MEHIPPPGVSRPQRTVRGLPPRHWIPLAVLLAAVPLFFWKLAFTNLIFARGDTFFYFYPYWDYRAQALLRGEIPLWNPYLFMGAPFLANPQAGVLYPLNWPLLFFPAPAAVKIAILLHVGLAAVGAYALARRLGLSQVGAALAAVTFALGGHLTAKVEQVNQLQGLAWLPWLLLALEACLRERRKWRAGLALSALLALQLLAGHTQTTFISLVALGAWWLARGGWRSWQNAVYPAAFLALGFLLAAAQLVPTLELARQSFRSGGLSFNEALSFSLNPLLLGRALLPGFSRAISSEFVGYLGVSTLALAAAGLARSRGWRAVPLLAGLGLFLALGGYNPLYRLLVRFAPGFDLFRAPARWLALWALGAALLAGHGYDQLRRLTSGQRQWAAAGTLGVGLALMALTLASAGLAPPGEAGPLGAPGGADWLAWSAALGIGIVILLSDPGARAGGRARAFANSIAPLAIVIPLAELFMASFRLPLNNLTTPDAYSSIRPAMTQLLATRGDTLPPGRFLSMSALLFDPGDLPELRGILEPQLPERAVFDAIVATKAREVLSPNLPLTWNVPAVDGYDGGVLPLRSYADFTRQLTGGELSPDGRLREYVTQTPPNWLLNVTNTRWLVTDKVGDAWIDDVFYDLQFEVALHAGQAVAVGRVPAFDATAVGLVVEAPPSANPVGYLRVTLAEGGERRTPISASQAPSGATRVGLGEVERIQGLAVESAVEGLIVRGVSLIDERSGAFQSLALGPYRLAHSGDVKIYENLNVFPRAYLVASLPLSPDSETIGRATVRAYESRRIVVEVDAPQDATLVLADAMYPGWGASIDGSAAEVETANGLFRAVRVPAGTHAVVFEFRSGSWTLGVWISVGALILWAGCMGLTTDVARRCLKIQTACPSGLGR